jgi:MFS family permease
VDTALDLFAASWLPILFATLTGLVATLLAVVAVSLVAEYLAARAGQRRRRVLSMRGAGAHGYGTVLSLGERLPVEYEPAID